jgi:small subunit ribosomal protein S18
MNDFKKKRGKRRKICKLCVDKVQHVDYKEVNRLSKYVTERGKILPRRISGNCAHHQRQVTTAIKNARVIALLPYSVEG